MTVRVRYGRAAQARKAAMASSDSDDDSDDYAERIARVREMAVSVPKRPAVASPAASSTKGSRKAEKSSRSKGATGGGGQDPRMTSTPPADGLSKQERKRIKKARQRAEKRQHKELEQGGAESAVGPWEAVAGINAAEGEAQGSAKKHKTSKKDSADREEEKGGGT